LQLQMDQWYKEDIHKIQTSFIEPKTPKKTSWNLLQWSIIACICML
jgi:hypothetical protein